MHKYYNNQGNHNNSSTAAQSNHVGSLFYDRSKPKTSSDKTNQLYHMKQDVKNSNKVSFFLWMEYNYYRLQHKWQYYVHYFKDRFQKTGWTILFAFLFLYFVHALCFIQENKRISNEWAKIGAFMMALCLLISYLFSTKWYLKMKE